MKSANLIYKTPSGRILLTALAVLFVLCGGPAFSASEPGTVTIVLSAEPRHMDPGNSEGTYGQVMTKNVFEALTEINPADSSITPGLAQSWKQIDTNTWHFFLRKGVKFHDGADFNADAASFNIKRLYDKRVNYDVRLRFFYGFKMDGNALDSHTLEIKTDKFEPLLPTLMSTLRICSPNTPIDKLTRNPIGTGPYKFVKWDAGTQIVLERFDGYWGKQSQIKKATYLWRTESAVRAAMVSLGEADLTPNISPQDANSPDMDQYYLNSETSYFRIGAWEAPLNDRRVRMALNLAVDRNLIRGTIISKNVVLATQMIVPNIFGYNPDVKVWPYEPQKAKQLIDEARKDGVPVEKEILMVGRIGDYPGQVEEMEAIAAMYKAIGLNMKMKMLEVGVAKSYENKPYANVGPFIMQKLHDNNKGDAVFTVFQKYHCTGSQSPICEKKLDEVMEKAQGSIGEERRRLWQAAFKRIQEEIIPDVILFHMVAYCRVGKRITFKPTIISSNEIPLAQITFK